MTLLDDGSNGSIVVTLILGSIICAALSVLRAMRHVDFAIRSAWEDDKEIVKRTICDCDGCNAFGGYRPNREVGKPWWMP